MDGRRERNVITGWKNMIVFVCCAGNHFSTFSFSFFNGYIFNFSFSFFYFRKSRMLDRWVEFKKKKDFSYLFSLTGKGVTLGAKRARQVAITVETFLLVDRLVVIFL